MVKVYYTYNQASQHGMSISKTSNFLLNPIDNNLICGVNQYINIISSKTGQIIRTLHQQNKNVNIRYVYYYDGRVYGGYEDGEIVVWGYHTGEVLSVFDMHKTTVSCILVDESNTKMVSASMDGSIIVWDLLSQQHHQMYFKSAHPAPITQLHLTTLLIKSRPTPIILSIAKDGFLRIWNQQNYLCLDAISCQVTQAYSMYFDSSRNLVFVGTNKEDIVVVEVGDQEAGKVLGIRGVVKKKSFGRAVQMCGEFGLLYVFNSDKTIEVYKMLVGKDLQARKKRLQSRKKKSQPTQQPEPNLQPEPQPTEQPLAYLKLHSQKTVPFKFYNSLVHNSEIYLNNGTNIYNLSTQSQITYGIGRTEQLSIEYPYLLQRSNNALNLYTSTTFNKLYTVEVKATCACLFGKGYVLVVGDSVLVWDVRGNREVCRLEGKYVGASVQANKGLLWRENQLTMFQVGYDKNKNIKIKITDTRKFQDKITQAVYKHNPDKYILSLQNSQLLINHSDTHKQFLKLYGHKLPVTTFSLSTDDSLLATGSLDKDIKLWDLQFGNTIKTIFAHQEGITIVKFIEETHYLFSGAKDGHVKFWDMDTWELIMDFQQSLGEVRGLAVSVAGDVLVVGGLDEGFRVWKQTGDQTIASDIQDKNMQKLMIEDYTKQKLSQSQQKTRYEDLKHGQQIIQALQQKQTPKKLLSMLKQIPPANLKSSLSFLHERHLRRLEEYIHFMMSANYEVETCWRVVREIGRGTQLGKKMRDVWRPVEKIIGINLEVLKILKKEVQQMDQIV